MTLTLEEILGAIKENNSEIKNMNTNIVKIGTALEHALKELNDLKIKNEKLQKQVNIHETEINFLRREVKKNNLVLFNVTEKENEAEGDTLSCIRELFQRFEININEDNVNECHRIGKKSGTRPVLLALTNSKLKKKILEKREDLKTLKISPEGSIVKEERVAEF
ncbi:hypothetical protein O3M35_011710 [Rhynocoris fuscipes]|uniref:Endonuclease-reverse transcriptase n=1 Tax=Rhynocoris fuscipes TaxID=488301 RepID=A0AAW1CYJ8_9HEMI